MNTDIATVNFTETELALADLRTKYAAAVFDVTTGKGMTGAKEARAELRGCRMRLEESRKAKKADALEYGRKVDGAARALLTELESMESPIDAQIKAEETRKANAKEEAERIALEKQAIVAERFGVINAMPLRAVNATADEIRAVIAEAEALDPRAAWVPENLHDAARHAIGLAVLALRAALDKRNAEDAERVQIEKDRAELAEMRKANEERDRQARAQAEREAQERAATEKAAKDAQDRKDAEKRAQDAETARIERERIAAEQETARKANEAEASRLAKVAAEIEKARKEAARKARADAVSSATILDAAADAVEFLKAKGFGGELVVEKLESAIAKARKAEGSKP